VADSIETSVAVAILVFLVCLVGFVLLIQARQGRQLDDILILLRARFPQAPVPASATPSRVAAPAAATPVLPPTPPPPAARVDAVHRPAHSTRPTSLEVPAGTPRPPPARPHPPHPPPVKPDVGRFDEPAARRHAELVLEAQTAGKNARHCYGQACLQHGYHATCPCHCDGCALVTGLSEVARREVHPPLRLSPAERAAGLVARPAIADEDTAPGSDRRPSVWPGDSKDDEREKAEIRSRPEAEADVRHAARADPSAQDRPSDEETRVMSRPTILGLAPAAPPAAPISQQPVMRARPLPPLPHPSPLTGLQLTPDAIELTLENASARAGELRRAVVAAGETPRRPSPRSSTLVSQGVVRHDPRAEPEPCAPARRPGGPRT
jgi:hypothetical protein